MANLNKIILAGRLAADPEIRTSLEGVAMAKFSMEVSSFGKPSSGSIEVVAWQRLAEICGQYLKKGRLILVEGRLQIRSFEDQSGQRRWVTEVIASQMQMLDGKVETVKSAETVNSVEEASGVEEVEELPEDDLPF